MDKGFTFDGALLFPFRAAHGPKFLFVFAGVYAVVGTLMTAIGFYLAKDLIFGMIDRLDGIVQAAEMGVDDETALQMMGSWFSYIFSLWPMMIISLLVSWVFWVMFETASQRRYIRDENFSLRFGQDEINMFGTSFFWFLLQGVLFIAPMLIGFSSFLSIFDFMDGTISENEFGMRVAGSMGIMAVLMLFLFPLYVFLATRFAPCFGLTIKDRKVAFRDAWAVSRGRFWPILGAFLIIIIAGGMVGSVISSIGQAVLMPAMMNFPIDGDVPRIRDMITPGLLISSLIYTFLRLFVSGMLMHIADGPAAFAARNDPRGGVDDNLRLTEFD